MNVSPLRVTIVYPFSLRQQHNPSERPVLIHVFFSKTGTPPFIQRFQNRIYYPNTKIESKLRQQKAMNLRKLCLPLNESERNLCANLSNCSAALYQTLNESSTERKTYQRCNWLGFYLLPEGSKELVLGPFQGKVAVVRIPVGKGVCGVSALTKKVPQKKTCQEFRYCT